jgi:hypothetical protein
MIGLHFGEWKIGTSCELMPDFQRLCMKVYDSAKEMKSGILTFAVDSVSPAP